MKMTSACANKMLKKLNEDKAFWRAQEQSGHLYTASENEEPVIPEYDYVRVSAEIAEIIEGVAECSPDVLIRVTFPFA